MRILLFSSTYAPQIGGVETVTRRLARELRLEGHEVSVYTNRYPRSLASHSTLDGIPVSRRLYPNLLPSPGRRRALTLVKQALSIPLAAWELLHLWQHLGRLRPDVVNVHYFSYPAAYALIASRLRRLPVVLCFHGSDVASCPYPASYRWTMPWACGVARVVIVCSENLLSYLKRDLGGNLSERARVSHYGTDLERAPSESPDIASPLPDLPERFIYLPSRLIEKKGVHVAITAASLLKGQGRDLKLVIAGDGPLRPNLEALVRDLDIGDDVIFLGSVAHTRSLELMSRASFVVVPSMWEAFGQVCLEAMAAGKAVVGSNSGGIGEIVQDGKTGVLVPPDNSESLATAMAALLEDPLKAASMGAEGRRRAELHFTWKQMIDRYQQAFDAAQLAVSAPTWGISD